MTKERQLRKQEEIRNIILEAARDIISREGVKGLSIRKITNAIEYSPAIIYHYFKDKNEIIETLVGEGYKRILDSLSSVAKNESEPEEEIKEVFTKYIKAALDNKDEYMAVMLNDDPLVKQKTIILEKGISQKSRTIGILSETLKRGIQQGRFAAFDAELTAQIMWTSAFGLTMKLMIEADIPKQQVDDLVENHFRTLFYGIMRRKEEE
ncbi:MAG: transcriptional regulator, TetR family [Clostridia bacterium]|jgi:AcrR family transcriptional regulator|nr:transcriptional regulator, TetR family [Clostridia bacterium]